MISARIVFLILSCLGPIATAQAQLRPLDPVEFSAFSGDAVRVQAGLGVYFDQHASLGGTRGTLSELGQFQVAVRTGRMVMEIGGTIRRLFKDEERINAPYAEVRPAPADGRRSDDGDYRVATALRLTSAGSRTLALLRFGTRLPTPDNRVGLDRDATDFFATFGAQHRLGRAALGVEAGVGIHGTRDPTYEQADVLVYALTGELDLGRVVPSAAVVGHQDFHDWAIRGNEDLSELRIGLRAGRKHWLRATWIHGLTEFSPSNGLQIAAGMIVGSR